MGLRLDWLGSAALSWRDLLVIVRQVPSDSALSRAMHPKTWQWALTPQLVALLYNATIGKQGVKIPGSEADQEQVVTGSGAVPIDEFYKFWNGDGAGGGSAR